MRGIIAYWRAQKYLHWILLLFLTSRIMLTLIGVTSRELLMPAMTEEARQRHSGASAQGITGNRWIDIWGVWDTGWYLNIAQNGYTTDLSGHGGANYGFFPLYPWLMRLVGTVVGSNYVGGVIVANLAFIAACIVLHKMTQREYGDAVARRSVQYLVLFPTAFIFSAAFSESVFLLSLLLTFYFARGNRWLLAGICGGCVALTRSVGIFVAFPLLYEYLRSRDFRPSQVRPDILALGLVPLGLAMVCWLNYRVTGDLLAFAHVQQTGWGHEFSNPLGVLWTGLTDGDFLHRFNALFAIGVILTLALGFRWIGFTWWLAGMIPICFPLFAGKVCLNSLLRYAAVVFPISIVLAQIPDESRCAMPLCICLGLFQGFLMVFWTAGFALII